MTDVKEQLSRARRTQIRIDQRIAEIKRLEEMRIYLSATDYSSVVVKHSAGRGSVEQLATDGKLDTLRRRLSADVERLAGEKLEAISIIGSLEDKRMQDVLWEYYIHAAVNWDTAARAAGYSRRQALRIHGQALQILREKMALNVTGDT
jgi:hypothetical protein